MRTSRHTANLSCGVFIYYNLAIKHTVCNSVIWSGADVLMLVYFLFLHFRMNENSSTMFEYWSFVFWILVKTCGKNCLRTCCCSFQTNCYSFCSFITVSYVWFFSKWYMILSALYSERKILVMKHFLSPL